MIEYTVKINKNGDRFWYINGKLHRENGPAVEQDDSTKYWYINDELHREDGPAIEYVDGTKAWYLNDLLHREDGPAFEGASGTKAWCLNGVRYSEKEFNEKMTPVKEYTVPEIEELVELLLGYKVKVIK